MCGSFNRVSSTIRIALLRTEIRADTQIHRSAISGRDSIRTRALDFSADSYLSSKQSKRTRKRRTEMGKIVITTNVSLDGVVQDPDGEEGFMRGGWFNEFGGKDLQGWAQVEAEEALGAEALLLGRRSDEWFASRWLSRDGAWADKLNSMPKYVVSSTLADPRWSNSTVIKGDVVSEVSKLKQQISGEILVYASYQLVRTLIEHDLVDELRLVIFPVVVGEGERLFGETREKKPMRLLKVNTIGDGLAFVSYEVVKDA
jgi:dihydrofolate reductase